MMKVKIPVFLILLSSCSGSMESRIRSAIEKEELSKFGKTGVKVLSLTVDSIEYYSASLKDFYKARSAEQIKDNTGFRDRQLPVIDAAKGHLHDSLNKAFYEEVQSRVDKLRDLSIHQNHADTIRDLYMVDYRLRVKASDRSLQRASTIFLRQSDLSPVSK